MPSPLPRALPPNPPLLCTKSLLWHMEQERVHGFSALMMAAHMGHLSCVVALIEAGADTKQTLLHGSETAYSLSLSAGHPEIARVLSMHSVGRRAPPLPSLPFAYRLSDGRSRRKF